jgi:hypothetical protein
MLNSSNIMNGAPKHRPLTDEELASLLTDSLSPTDRAELIERLGDDPESQQTLAIAASSPDSPGEALSQSSISSLMAKVRESVTDTGICPHCASDLNPSGDFCPHCGAHVKGDIVTCMKCGKPVSEDGTYCPHCGSFFRSKGRTSRGELIDSPALLLIPGIFSIIIAIAYHPLFILFLTIGCVLLGAWIADLWARRKLSARIEQQSAKQSDEEKAKDAGRKSG